MSTASFDDGTAPGANVLLTDTYRLGRLIRRGGTSEIYEATHARLPGRYAVKILAPELAGNREAFARFCHEAEVMSELRHPNLVQIFDFNSAPDQRPYFVMEYLEGRDLGARLADSEPPTLPAIVRLVEAVASALAAAHAHGVVHRDLKPANIFLVAVDGQPDELVKVLDFGISKVPATTAPLSMSMSTEISGSPPYMSPEQVRGATAEIDGRTDQFALGAIAYRMLTGHDAFEATDVSAVLYQIAHEPARPLAHHLPVAWDARPLQAVLDRALAKDPAERWGGMMEMARAFEAAAERTLSPSSREPASAEPPPVRFDVAPIEESAPEAAPRALEPRAPAPMPMPMALEPELSDTLDRIPVKHHRMAAAGAVALALVGLLVATGWYRRIPATVPRVRQSLAAWLEPKQPPRPVAVTPPEAAVTQIQPPAAPVAAPPVVAAEGPPAAPQPDPPADPANRESAPAPRTDVPAPGAATEPRHHPTARQPRFRGHPGSIELTPTAPADPTAAAAPDGFPIAPPAPSPDSPARDLVPPADPESPPPSTSTGGPTAPSTP